MILDHVTIEYNNDALAPSILLNGTLAIRALLGVTLDPIGSFAVISTLLQPQFADSADERSVIPVDVAAEAKHMLR